MASSPLSPRAIYEGQLCKKGKFNKSWKNRWCSLCTIRNGDIVLEYYDSKMNRKLCGTVDLSQVYGVEVISDYDLNLMKKLPENILINTTIKSEKNFSFQINTPQRQFLFAAFDPPSFFAWIQTLDKYIYGNVVKQGWMMKKGEKNKGWKRRYFVLNEYKQIKYYQDFEKTLFCGTIHLNKVSSITNGKVYTDEYKYTFELITGKRIWILCCKDIIERQSWHMQIKKTIGEENLSNKLTLKMKHNMQIAHMTQLSRLKYLEIEQEEENKSDIDSEHIDNDTDDYKCTSIRNCIALNRITMNLHFYANVNTYDEDCDSLLSNYWQHNGNILNDYSHLLQFHLNDGKRAHCNEIFQVIYDMIRKYVTCDVFACKAYKRNIRDRIYDKLPHKDKHISFYIDVFDTIHCTFLHSYDIGYRINTSQLNNNNIQFEMNYFHKLLQLKRKKTISQHRNHKYSTMFLNTSRTSRNSFSSNENDMNVFDEEKQETMPCFDNDYIKCDPIGAIGGTFGNTYLCHKKSDNKTFYAVKQISKAKFYRIGQQKRMQLLQNLKNEMELITVLKHENIVELHQVYEDRNFVYLVMDYVRGFSLFEGIIKLQSFSERKAAQITKQIFTALAYMQSNNIYHFMLKPENIMFINEELIEITDFGVASLMNENVCLCGTVTPYYSAPEVVSNGAYDRASDVWSVGVILFCMLYGYAPFYVYENVFANFGQKQQDEIYELISKGFNPQIRKGYGPFFPKDIEISVAAMSLISGMLSQNITERLTVTECLRHEWIVNGGTDEMILKQTVIASLNNFVGTLKFKALITKLFTKKINLSSYSNILQVFKKYDVENDGEITLKAFREGIKEAFTDVNDEELHEIFNNLDVNDSRSLCIDELIINCTLNALVCVDEEMHRSFCELDKNENGLIGMNQLKKVINELQCYDEKYIENIDVIIKELETDVSESGELNINYEEFLCSVHPQYKYNYNEKLKLELDIADNVEFMNKKSKNRNIKKIVRNMMTININAKGKNDEKEEIIINDSSFGMRFNYIDVNDVNYVKAKHASLKEEILCDLALDHYEYCLLKVDYFMDSKSVKNMQSKINYNIISMSDTITLQHILAVILYCDYDLLHSNVAKTFYKLSEKESFESVAGRNSAYHHFCKLLSESVNEFGSICNENYYHCIMNDVMFNQFNVNMCAIISVTKQIEIAVNCIADMRDESNNHNNNGMVMELSAANKYVSGFNCNFLSFFSYENEIILFGANASNTLHIESISMLLNGKWQNYGKIIHSINIYKNALNGKKITENSDINECVFDTVKKLIECELDNENHTLFIHKYFHLCCIKTTKIVIDLKYIFEFYAGFGANLISSVNNELLRFNEIVKLYPNCKYIITQKDNGKTAILISSQYFNQLLSMMDEINKYSNLKVINIINPNTKCSKNKYIHFRDKFKQKQWIINNEHPAILSICKQ